MKRFVFSACCLALGATLSACNDTPIGISDGSARIRIVNSTFQYTDADSTVGLVAGRAIDFEFDGSTSTGGAAAIPALSISPAPSATPQANYRELSQGLHAFTARLSSPATPGTSLFTSGSDPIKEFIPKLFFTGDTYYTVIVAGFAPTIGMPAAESFVSSDQYSNPFPILDDNAPPPKRDGKYLARLRLVNAAPFTLTGGTTGASHSIIVTQGTTPPTPTELAAIRVSGTATYRSQSAYTNTPEGQYVITVVTGSPRTIIAQEVVTLTSGEVVTFLTQNTGPVDPAAPTAGFRMSRLIDAKF